MPANETTFVYHTAYMTRPNYSDGELKYDLSRLLTDPAFHDVILVCGDGVEIGACRAMLAARSTAFRSMLYGNVHRSLARKVLREVSRGCVCRTLARRVFCGDMCQSSISRLFLEEIRSPEIRIVLDYIHTDKIAPGHLDPQVALAVYRAASFFLLPGLINVILRRAMKTNDIGIASLLLNEAIVVTPPKNSNKGLYSVLLGLFCAHPLRFGDLDRLSEEALEFLLVETRERNFATSEYILLLRIIEWAWFRSDDPPYVIERYTLLEYLEREPSESAGLRICLESKQERSLLKMMCYMNFSLICPHRLRQLAATIEALTEITGQAMDFSQQMCDNTICSSGHPSGFRRQKPDAGWDRSMVTHDVIISEDSSVVELPRGIEPFAARTVRHSRPLMVADGSMHRWDIIIEEVGNYDHEMCCDIGLVGESFDQFHTGMDGEPPSYCFESYANQHYIVQGQCHPYGRVLSSGDSVTFSLNMNDRTCSLAINNQDYGVAWRNLPDKVYPAVTLCSGSRYRFQSRA